MSKSDAALVEHFSRVLCKADGTAQCAAICLSHFSSSTSDGKCPEAVRVWGYKAQSLAIAMDEMMEELGLALFFLSDRLLADGFFGRKDHHEVYERVVAKFQALQHAKGA